MREDGDERDLTRKARFTAHVWTGKNHCATATASDVVSKNLLSSLEMAIPGVGERVLTTHLGRGAQAFFGVGHYRELANFEKVQCDRRALGRRLYWAGDYLAGPSFESATRSGLRAAEAFLADESSD